MKFKNMVLNAAIYGALVSGGISTAHAVSLPGKDKFDKFIKTIQDKGPAEACKKGRLLSGTLTIRSLDGAFCLDKAVAAWAEETCPEIDASYNDSKCHNNAVKVLGGANPLGLLGEMAKTRASRARQLVCAANAPAQFNEIKAKVCGKAE